MSQRLIVIGASELTEHLARLADMLGYASVMALGEDLPRDLGPEDDVVVTMGESPEEGARARELLHKAAVRDCGYIGFVADERESVKALLQLSKEHVPKARLDRIAAPAGSDIGATTPGEQAVAIAAELVARRHGRKLSATPDGADRDETDTQPDSPAPTPRKRKGGDRAS